MKLFLIERTDPIGYDEYDSAVICADSEKEALTFVPWVFKQEYYKTTEIGIAKDSIKKGILLSSFNAG